MKKFFKEFKAFISRGNVFDMAVGLIIATAFNKIVSSLVNDIIMPIVTWATGANSLADLSVTLKTTTDLVTGNVTKLTWNYGMFLQTVIDFLIIALSVFLMVKVISSSQKKLLELGEEVIKSTTKQKRAERKLVKAQAKQEGRAFKEVWAEYEQSKIQQAQELAKQQELEKAEKEALDKLNNPTQEDLLKEIRDLLKVQNSIKAPVKKTTKVSKEQ